MKRTTTLLLMLTLGGPGCTSEGNEGEEGAEPGAGEVPAALLAVEGAAEDAYDKALLADYAAVMDAASLLDTKWSAFRGEAKQDGAAQKELDAMDAAIGGLMQAADSPKDEASVARAANAVSAPMDELFALYDPTVPPAVLALDYLGREVVLDGMDTDFAAAGADVDDIESTWAPLEALVVDAGGTTEADDYAASIADLRDDIAAHDDQQLVIDANAGLELVDSIEQVF